MELNRQYPLNCPLDMRRAFDRIYDLLGQQHGGNGNGVNDAQLQRIIAAAREAGRQEATNLIGAFGQPLVGDVSSADPLVVPVGQTAGTVTSFSAGDLSPLFTTTEANVTTTPALSFAQIVQNANKVFAGPTSGADANPAFRLPVAADVYLIAETLLAPPTTVDLNTTSAQDLYQVPSGKSLHVLNAVVYGASVDISGYLNSVALLDNSSGESVIDDFTAAQWAFLADANHFFPSPGHAGANPPYRIVTAGNKVRAKPSVAFGSAATIKMALFGYLF